MLNTIKNDSKSVSSLGILDIALINDVLQTYGETQIQVYHVNDTTMPYGILNAPLGGWTFALLIRFFRVYMPYHKLPDSEIYIGGLCIGTIDKKQLSIGGHLIND
ncbi:hypothetical protein [Zooshikella sp. RANM57]|uniref:hypothetical protein n=1 Tax=Zooshikella sp. RANM57 TaxID=3425863 RepID=UPI003D6DBE01